MVLPSTGEAKPGTWQPGRTLSYDYSLLLTKQHKPRKQIAQETGMHPRSLDRRLQQIVHDGIPLTLTDCEEPLPPLSISL